MSVKKIPTKSLIEMKCVYMDRVSKVFLETQELQTLLLLRYIDSIFSFGLMERKN